MVGRADELARLLAHVDRAAAGRTLRGAARRRRRRRQDPAARRAHRPGGRRAASGCSPGTASTSATSACPTCRSSTCCARWPPIPSSRPSRRGQPGARRAAGRPARRRSRRCRRPSEGRDLSRPLPNRAAPQPVDDGRLQLFESVAGAASASWPRPARCCIVLEDVHWADRSSRDLLRYLLARLVDEPVAVVASYRADDLHRRHPLRPLLAELVRLPGVERLELGAAARRRGRRAGPRPGRVDRRRARVDRRRRRRPCRGQRVLRRGAARRRPARRGAAARADRRPAGPGRAALAGGPAGAADRRRGRPAGAARAGRRRRRAGDRRAGAGPRRGRAPPPAGRLRRRALPVPARAAARGGARRPAARGAGAAARRRSPPTWPATPGRGHGGRAGAPRPREQRPARRLQRVAGGGGGGLPGRARRPSSCSTWRRRSPSGRRCPTRPSGPAATRRRCCSRPPPPRARWGSCTGPSRCCASALELLGPDADPAVRARVHYTLAQAMVRVEDVAGAHRESAAAMALVPADPPSEVRTWAAATHARMSYSLGLMAEGDAAAEEALAAADALGLDSAWSDTAVSQVRARPDERPGRCAAPAGRGAASGPAAPATSTWRCGCCSTRPRVAFEAGRIEETLELDPAGHASGRATSASSGRSTRPSCGTCRSPRCTWPATGTRASPRPTCWPGCRRWPRTCGPPGCWSRSAGATRRRASGWTGRGR